MANPSMTIIIGADNSEFLKKISQTQRALKRGLGNDALGASAGALGIIGGLTAGLGALGIASIKLASDFQVSKKAFGVLLGDAQKAEKFLGDLSQFAAQTPFELPGLTDAAKKLLAFKFEAEDVIPIMSAIGDTASLLGTGQEGIDGMVTALGQMQAKGKVSAEEMKQFAERGVNAWQYLAEAMGVSTAEAMDKVSKGTVSAQQGIEAIVKGMQKDFKGGMEGLSREIPGILSTISDNAGSVAREMGDRIITALDLKPRLQGMADYLTQFAGYVKNNGINKALRDMIPKEVSLAAFILAGALLGAAVPAMVSFGIAAWGAIVPLIPFMVKGAALAALAWVIWQAWEPLGDMFAGVWTYTLAWTEQKWAQIKGAVLSGAQYVLQAVQPLLSLFGGGMQEAVSGWLGELAGEITAAAQEAQTAGAKADQAAADTGTALAAIGGKLSQGAVNIAESVSGINREFSGLHGNVQNTGGALQNMGAGGAKALNKLAEKAKRVSESIREDWARTTQTQFELLDAWLDEQTRKLEDTKAANANYERDKQYLAETYAEKRRKLLLEEKKDILDIQRSISDMAGKFRDQSVSFDLKGSSRQKFDFAKDARDQIQEMERGFADLSIKWEGMAAKEKNTMREALEASGVLFKETEEGKISFAEESAKRRAEIERQAAEETAEYIRSGQAFADDMDAARKEGDIQAYAALLASESAILSQELAGRQEMIDVHYEIWQEAHRSAMSYMAEAIKGLYSGVTTFFTDILEGNKTIGQAFQDLGKSIINMIIRMAAQWLASRLMMAAFGKAMQAGELAAATAAGAGVASAWAPAAAMVSLATMGANSGPAMAGMSAAAGLAMGLSGIPGLAAGGVTTGPTLANIGEGHRREAVLPLDKKLFERMGLTEKESTPAQVFSINISALDARSVETLLRKNGGALVRSLGEQASIFNTGRLRPV